MRRLVLAIASLIALAGGGLAVVSAGDDAARPSPDPVASDPLLRSGAERYAAYLEAESPSLRAAKRARDWDGVVIYAGRVAPARGHRAGGVDTLAAVSSASRLLAADARRVGSRPLLGVESRVAGAAVAFDAIREATWQRDEGLNGSIDVRLNRLRAELDRHRRGTGFVDASSLGSADRRRLAAALRAYAWRLGVAAERIGDRAG